MARHLRLVRSEGPPPEVRQQLDGVLLLADRLEMRAEAHGPYEHLLGRDLRSAAAELRALRLVVLLLTNDRDPGGQPVTLQFGCEEELRP